jgi:S1-C subfamily serine protease
MRWYVHRRGKTVGPISHTQLLEYYANGRLLATDLASVDGTTWLPLTQAIQSQPIQAKQADDLADHLADHLPQAEPVHHRQPKPYRSPLVEANPDEPANEPTARPAAKYWPVIVGSSAAVIAALLLLLTVVIVYTGNRPPQADAAGPTPSPNPAKPAANDSPAKPAAEQRPLGQRHQVPHNDEPELVIRSLQDEDNIAKAVGLVVCGIQGRRFDGQLAQLPISTGTCFAISPDGHLLTNAHVITPMIAAVQDLRQRGRTDINGQVWVFFGQEQKFVARILNLSRQFDLAVLETMQTNSPYFALCRSEKLSRGLTVTALGFPGASMEPLSRTEMMLEQQRKQMIPTAVEQAFRQRDFVYVQTSGKISRVVTEEGGVNWIQHDTNIHPGNSGGPLLDDQATVLGINTLKHMAAGGISYSFTMPQIRSEIQPFVPNVVWR